jgi:hypothetical protein
LARFLKGSTTIGELRTMPAHWLSTLFKIQFEQMKTKDGEEAVVSEQAMEEIEDTMTS